MVIDLFYFDIKKDILITVDYFFVVGGSSHAVHLGYELKKSLLEYKKKLIKGPNNKRSNNGINLISKFPLHPYLFCL